MARKIRKVLDEEMDQLERELEEYLREPIDSWKEEPRYRLFFKLQAEREAELEKYRSERSANDKTD